MAQEQTAARAMRARLEELADRVAETPATPLEKALLPVFNQYRSLEGKKVLVLFSGGLDTSYIVHFLANVIGAEVVTFTADVGSTEPRGESWAQAQEKIRERAREMGASDHVSVDCREKLAHLAMTAVKAEAALDGGKGHPPGSSLSRVVISEAAIEALIAHECSVVFHGSNGTQNNPYRYHNALQHFAKQHDIYVENSSGYEATQIDFANIRKVHNRREELPPRQKSLIMFLNYALDHAKVILEATPNIDCPLTRDDAEAYLKHFGISIKKDSTEGNISTDENLCGNEREEAGLSDISHPYYPIDTPPEAPTRIAIRFKHGVPVALKEEGCDWQEMNPLPLIEKLNAIGYKRHIGVFDTSEMRPIGTKEREVHISPAMAILNETHYRLRKNILPNDQNYLFSRLSNDWSTLVMEANQWAETGNGPRGNFRERLDEAFDELNQNVTGEVAVTLNAGRILSPEIHSPHVVKSETVRGVTSAEVESAGVTPPIMDFMKPDITITGFKNHQRLIMPLATGKMEELHQECISFIEHVLNMRKNGVTHDLNQDLGIS